MNNKINIELLNKMLNEGYVMVQKHPNLNLFIYNYTQFAQYEKVWNEITLMCRGLILDGEYNIIARPFSKFFNIEEHQPNEIPNLPFEVFKKMDGSLGILFTYNDKPFIASRGSFTSEQSIFANKILNEKYFHCLKNINPKFTYLFEIIYPEDRKVIDYNGLEDIILLAIIDNETGMDVPFDYNDKTLGFNIVKKYDGLNDLSKLKSLEVDNEEGFVVRFSNGFRIKVKFSEYIRIHRIISCVSNIAIWESLREGKSIKELLDRVPDEFFNWVKHTENDLINKFNVILEENKKVFKELETRKETAEYFKTQKYPSILFNMLDGKKPDDIIWKLIRPKFSKPFSIDE